MIPSFLEGLAQSGLPCSWVIVVPAVIVGLSTKRVAHIAVFAGSIVALSWAAVSGWLSPPLWLAGVCLLLSAAAWWRWGVGAPQVALAGAGAAWAWQPCVGEQLGRSLNLAQHDPLVALPGLASFMIGVIVVGLAVGEAIRWLLSRRRTAVPRWLGPGVVGLLGVLMVSGLYDRAASELARWSATIWG